MKKLQINKDHEKGVLAIDYSPETSKTLFDICDLNGGVIKTGELEGERTEIDISDLSEDRYFLLILDGEKILKEPFHVNHQA